MTANLSNLLIAEVFDATQSLSRTSWKMLPPLNDMESASQLVINKAKQIASAVITLKN
jgi:hypothetical protein